MSLTLCFIVCAVLVKQVVVLMFTEHCDSALGVLVTRTHVCLLKENSVIIPPHGTTGAPDTPGVPVLSNSNSSVSLPFEIVEQETIQNLSHIVSCISYTFKFIFMSRFHGKVFH